MAHMNPRDTEVDENFYSNLVHLKPYLKYLFLLKKQSAQARNLEIPFSDFKQLRSNVKTPIRSLSDQLSTSDAELDEMIEYWNQFETAEKPIRFLKKNSLPPKLRTLADSATFLELTQNVKKNHAIAEKWIKRANKFDKVASNLEFLNRELNFPMADLVLGFVQSPIGVLLRSTQLWAKHYNPDIILDKDLAKNITFLNSVGLATSTVGLTAIALGGAFTGVAVAPIALFIYASINVLDKIYEIVKNSYELYHESFQKDPKQTYGLRMANPAVNIVYNLATGGFKVLLGIVAFIAIVNPLGLVITSTVLGIAAIVTVFMGATSLWLNNKIKARIKQIENNVLTPDERDVSITHKLINKKVPQNTLQNSLQNAKPITANTNSHDLLAKYEEYSNPNANISWKEQVNIQHLKQEVQALAAQNGLNLHCEIEKRNPQAFKIIRTTDEGRTQEIATVHCQPHRTEYQLTHDTNYRHSEGMTKNIISDRDAELRTLLLSIQKNNPDSLKLNGGSSREVLLIYKIAMDIGLTQITITPNTAERVKQLHPDEFNILEERHKHLIELQTDIHPKMGPEN